MQQDQQWKWVEAGAQTGRVDILKDAKYSTTKPWNATFPNSMSFVKDYWHLVEYPQLLDIYQKYVSLAVSNEMDPKTALDNVAKEQQPILDKIK
jgi:multiple sugar transport system substrate-binding protein